MSNKAKTETVSTRTLPYQQRLKVYDIVRECVAHEPGYCPMPDSEIARICGERGINLTPEAVQHYRKRLGIASWQKRFVDKGK